MHQPTFRFANKETGIHFGVISQNSVNLDCMDSVEYDYGKPHCPECGNEIGASSDVEPDAEWNDGKDYACSACKECFWSDTCFPDEPLGWSLDDGEYKLTDCLDTDIFVLESPYYTLAQYCSPCVPGAGNLDSPYGAGDLTSEDSPSDADAKSYCLGPDWFDRFNRMPYRCFRIADNVEVFEDWLYCDQCQMLSINGTATHETGCPNSRKDWNVRNKAWENAEVEE